MKLTQKAEAIGVRVAITSCGRVFDEIVNPKEANGVALTYAELEQVARQAFEAGREVYRQNNGSLGIEVRHMYLDFKDWQSQNKKGA